MLAPERPEQYKEKPKKINAQIQASSSRDTRKSKIGNFTDRSTKLDTILNTTTFSRESSFEKGRNYSQQSFSITQLEKVIGRTQSREIMEIGNNLDSRRSKEPKTFQTENYYNKLVSTNTLKPRRPMSPRKESKITCLLHVSGEKAALKILQKPQQNRPRLGKKKLCCTPVSRKSENNPLTFMPKISRQEEPNMILKEGGQKRQWR